MRKTMFDYQEFQQDLERLRAAGIHPVRGGATSIQFDGPNDRIYFGTDGTVDIGTTTNRAANVYTDALGDTGQTLTVKSPSLTIPTGAAFDIALATAAGDDFTVDTVKLVVEGDAAGVKNREDDGGFYTGAGDDLRTYHDGTSSIVSSASHTLRLRAPAVGIENAAGTETMATFGANGAVTLYHDNVGAVGTMSGGIDMLLTGNRIDLDTDNDTSIRAGSDDRIDFELGGADLFQMLDNDAGAGGYFAAPDQDAGDGNAGRYIKLGRNSNVTNPGAGFIELVDKSGTSYFVWPDDTGVLRIHTSKPSTANDTAGTVVGAQS
jgi:hypothetical protein